MSFAPRPLSAAVLLAAVVTLSACFPDGEPTHPTLPVASVSTHAAVALIPDQYIVTFRDDVADPAALASTLVTASGGSLLHVYAHTIKGFAARIPASGLAAVSTHPSVTKVEQDQMDHTTELLFEDEPFGITSQKGAPWGIDRIDQRDLPLDTVYRYSLTGRGVNVYIIDSGIRFAHEGFGGRASLGVDFVQDTAMATGDCNGHGTHVAGTVGSRLWGVAKQVNLISVRIFPCTGGSPRSRTIGAVDWVTANAVKPAVVNMSLGGNNEAYPGLSTLDQAVERSVATGIHYAVAAGNETANACTRSPANAPSAMTTGATTRAVPTTAAFFVDVRAEYSNFGPCVDIWAPGSGITSAHWQNNTGSRSISGTSMATPHVAGVLALYVQAYPTHSPAEAKAALLRNATAGKIVKEDDSANLLLFSVAAPLTIDVKPGSDEPKTINLSASGRLPVAILTNHHTAEEVKLESIRLTNGEGRGTAMARHADGRPVATYTDLNEDGLTDLILHFDMSELRANGDLTSSTTALRVTGTLHDGWPVSGAQRVRVQ